MILLYIVISLLNVFLHITRSILVIKSNKFIASLANCICYTFSAIVIKFIAEVDLWIAISVQAGTNFVGCYVAMWFCEKILKQIDKRLESDPGYQFDCEIWNWLKEHGTDENKQLLMMTARHFAEWGAKHKIK